MSNATIVCQPNHVPGVIKQRSDQDHEKMWEGIAALYSCMQDDPEGWRILTEGYTKVEMHYFPAATEGPYRLLSNGTGGHRTVSLKILADTEIKQLNVDFLQWRGRNSCLSYGARTLNATQLQQLHGHINEGIQIAIKVHSKLRHDLETQHHLQQLAEKGNITQAYELLLNRSPKAKNQTKVMFKIKFPSNQATVLLVDRDQTLQEVLLSVCKKRNISAAHTGVKFIQFGAPLLRVSEIIGKRVGELTTKEVELVNLLDFVKSTKEKLAALQMLSRHALSPRKVLKKNSLDGRFFQVNFPEGHGKATVKVPLRMSMGEFLFYIAEKRSLDVSEIQLFASPNARKPLSLHGSISKLKTSTLFIEWKKKKPTSSKTTKKKCGTEKQNSEISAKLGTLQAVARVRRGVYEGQSTSQADQQTLSAGNDSKSGDSMLNHLLDHRYFSTYDIPKGQTQTTLATQIKSSGCLNSSSGFYTSYNVDAIQPPPRQPLGYYQKSSPLCKSNLHVSSKDSLSKEIASLKMPLLSLSMGPLPQPHKFQNSNCDQPIYEEIFIADDSDDEDDEDDDDEDDDDDFDVQYSRVDDETKEEQEEEEQQQQKQEEQEAAAVSNEYEQATLISPSSHSLSEDGLVSFPTSIKSGVSFFDYKNHANLGCESMEQPVCSVEDDLDIDMLPLPPPAFLNSDINFDQSNCDSLPLNSCSRSNSKNTDGELISSYVGSASLATKALPPPPPPQPSYVGSFRIFNIDQKNPSKLTTNSGLMGPLCSKLSIYQSETHNRQGRSALVSTNDTPKTLLATNSG
eukprot:gene1159-4377_t